MRNGGGETIRGGLVFRDAAFQCVLPLPRHRSSFCHRSPRSVECFVVFVPNSPGIVKNLVPAEMSVRMIFESKGCGVPP